jgi:Amt family ammonium transporter
MTVKFLVHTDDALDLFAEHAIGGIIGLLANGLFGTKEVANLDGVSNIEGGWLDHNWKQLYKQFAYVCATSAYNFVVTALICKALDVIPGMSLRASSEAEELGMDDDQVSVCDYSHSSSKTQ